ncbi:MAG: ATP synthase F1 subunit delta [Bacteroidota bacterium]
MSNGRIAARYAKPILELAEEKNVLDEVKEDMQSFATLCEESRDFVLMLKSPIIPHLRKAEILKKTFDGKMNDLTLQAFYTITKKNRENVLDEIATEFMRQYNAIKGMEKVEVTTSGPLSGDQKKAFEKMATKITGKKPVLSEHLDPEIIGGYILKAGDRQIDQSVSGRLKDVKLKFLRK